MRQRGESGPEPGLTVVPGLVLRCVAVLFGLVAVLGFSVVTAIPAHAAGDRIESFDIDYTLRPDGVLEATETIVYEFGPDSGRHGIERYFITREPYDDTNDAVYTIENIDVSSPDDVATQFTTRTDEAKDGREEQLRIRIGDPNETIDAPTATYVLSYEVSGAMRSFDGYDELFWDATGLDWTASIDSVRVSATVPGGAQDVTCTYGVAQSTTTCAKADESGGKATFAQTDLAPGEGVTIGVKIRSGLVSDNRPHLVPDGSKLSPQEKLVAGSAVGLGALSVIGSPILGVLWWRKHGRDQRYAGLAPGTVPLAGQPTQIVAHDRDITIPVAFSPPKIPVAEAGLLIDGQVDPRETAATIIDLAVKGALTVRSSDSDEFLLTLVDPHKASAPHEMVLLNSVFAGQPPGAVVDLSQRGSMLAAHQAMVASVRNQVAARGWFRKVPSATATGSFGFGAIAVVVFAIFGLGAGALWVALPLLPILVTVAILRTKLRRGQRTPDGRAVCDQVEGFKTYLATAEADQLRFEEGEDIFSKYLPWAIAFDLADRWAKVCADLVRMGRLPDETPYWYYGAYNMTAFNTSFLTSSLTSAATPAPSAGSSGSGFGGGSSFSGGGFSGGGGGGGGGGSW